MQETTAGVRSGDGFWAAFFARVRLPRRRIARDFEIVRTWGAVLRPYKDKKAPLLWSGWQCWKW